MSVPSASICIFLVLAPLGCCRADENSSSNYGPYVARVTLMEPCLKNTSSSKNFTVHLEYNGSIQYVKYNFTLGEDIGPLSMKTMVSKMVNGKYQPMLKYSINKPCDRYLISMKSMFNVTNTCCVRKGSYTVKFAFDTQMRSMFGNKFFYGIFRIKSRIYATRRTFSCVDMVVDISQPN